MEAYFKKWINMEPLNTEDVLAILLKYDELFHNNPGANPQALLNVIQNYPINWSPIVEKALTLIGCKLKYDWITLYSKEGMFICRYENKSV